MQTETIPTPDSIADSLLQPGCRPGVGCRGSGKGKISYVPNANKDPLIPLTLPASKDPP